MTLYPKSCLIYEIKLSFSTFCVFSSGEEKRPVRPVKSRGAQKAGGGNTVLHFVCFRVIQIFSCQESESILGAGVRVWGVVGLPIVGPDQ